MKKILKQMKQENCRSQKYTSFKFENKTITNACEECYAIISIGDITQPCRRRSVLFHVYNIRVCRDLLTNCSYSSMRQNHIYNEFLKTKQKATLVKNNMLQSCRNKDNIENYN